MLNSYPSPSLNLANRQITFSSLFGMEFFSNHQNNNIRVIEFGLNHFAFKAAFYGTESVVTDEFYRQGTQTPPPHFGYNDGKYIGRLYKKNQYLIFDKLAKIYYPKIYPNYESSWKYSPTDFEKLRSDHTANLIFNDNNFNILLIKPEIIERD